MKRFAQLIQALDQTTKTTSQLAALTHYLEEASDEDKLWVVALFTHRRPKRPFNTTQFRTWAQEAADMPQWLFDESYHIVGDLAETIALILPQPETDSEKSLADWLHWLIALRDMEEEQQRAEVMTAWKSMPAEQRFVFNKLITGGFRIGVSQKMMVKALAKHLDRDENTIAHRLMGDWDPLKTTFHELLVTESTGDDLSKPYPFYLAYQLDMEPGDLGKPDDWQAEWKWDGIRGQVIMREGEVFVWSRGEELVTDKYPEYETFKNVLPNGTVLDGEILAYKDGRPMNFNSLQTRIGRKNMGKKLLENVPVVLMAYDLLEDSGENIRNLPMSERRKRLEALVKKAGHPNLLLSPTVPFTNWEELTAQRATSRQQMSEGIMLKRKDSIYQVGRKRGDWWKWKVDPLTIDAVMIYAMRGHGRRANLYTDYTFAVWKGDELVPFTKAYSGLKDEEFRKVDAFVKRNTIERFGPVRSVKAELVFEIAFEGIAKSTRHKSGISLRFPRMKRWRQDKPASEANTLEDLKRMLEEYG